MPHYLKLAQAKHFFLMGQIWLTSRLLRSPTSKSNHLQTNQMPRFTCWLLLYASILNTFEIPKLFILLLYFCIYLQYRTYSIRNGQSVLPFVFNDIMGLESGESAGADPEDIAKDLEGLLKEGYNVRRKLYLFNYTDLKWLCEIMSMLFRQCIDTAEL